MKTFSPEMEELLRQRIEQRYNEGRLKQAYSIDPQTGNYRAYSPQEQLEEIRRGTPKGEEFLLSEKKLKDELDKRL